MTQPALQTLETPSEPASGRARPLGAFVAWLCRKLFSQVRIDAGAVEHVRELSKTATVVYVMRQRSWVDYLLVAYVLAREGLPVPDFATGVSGIWFRPFVDVLRALGRSLASLSLSRWQLREQAERDRCQRLVASGRPVLIFMRGRMAGIRFLQGRRHALIAARTGSDYLREIVHHLWTAEQEVALVPLAVFRGRGMRRKDERLQTVVYSVQEMPTELRRLVSLLWNTRETSIRFGVEVRLGDFIRQYRREGEERLVRRLARAVQIFLYREERLVWGPPLLSKRQVRQRILQDPEVGATVRRLAAERRVAEPTLWRQAGRYFDEMAANFHGFYFSVLEFMFNRIWPRVFQGLEYSGLEKVIECVKQHPVVLVPCHRSHFDYLILSYIFHLNYLSPPHIAAGINLSFWPLGPLFRGAGAYFIRRRFGENELYKSVFRTYLTFLIREGYTQEFFIEGGRSRTGKILTPKLGMLSAIVEAFIDGARRDLYLVPVSIQYGRVVEEEAYQRELGGGDKPKETLRGLLQARSVLRRRHGTAYVTFAEPISLDRVLGSRREQLRRSNDPEVEGRKRRFTQKLGFRILREVNQVTVAGATSVSANVLLGHSHSACRQREFVVRAQALTRFLRHQGAQLSASLERNLEGEFRESLAFLSGGNLIQCLPGDDDAIIHVPPEKRSALEFYKNNAIHFFLLPALLSDALARGVRGPALKDDISWWLDLFRWEFPLPEREMLAAELGRLLDYLRAERILTGPDGEELQSRHPFVLATRGILDNFRESYWVAAQVLLSLPEGGLTRKAILERMHKRYATGLLLGEVRKPEGNSSVTLGNALSRFAEIDCVAVHPPAKGKEPIVEPGRSFSQVGLIAGRIASCVMRVEGAA